MKTVIITGANRGIGLELTKQFLRQNSKVHATYREEFENLSKIENDNLILHKVDVRNADEIDELVSSVNGGVDVLINNAGIADGRWQSIAQIDMAQALEVINVNSIAPVRVTQKFQNKMKQGSTIVMMSSLMGSISDCHSGRSYAYRASKTALNMFSIAMKNELLDQDISILIIHPGWVETDMGGPNAPLSVSESVKGIIQRIEEQNIGQSGRYVQYDGTPIEW